MKSEMVDTSTYKGHRYFILSVEEGRRPVSWSWRVDELDSGLVLRRGSTKTERSAYLEVFKFIDEGVELEKTPTFPQQVEKLALEGPYSTRFPGFPQYRQVEVGDLSVNVVVDERRVKIVSISCLEGRP